MKRLLFPAISLVLLLFIVVDVLGEDANRVVFCNTFADPQAVDEDDMCLWIHPRDPSLSTVIASDKATGKLFVYDLSGKTLQVIPVSVDGKEGKPGNIDIRYGFPLGDERVDIVAFNQRSAPYRIMIYRIDPETRLFSRVDDGKIKTFKNYGLCLYRDSRTGRLYAFVTSKQDGVEQYELFDDSAGKIGGRRVRSWPLGKCEGCVADDELGHVYISEEAVGIWRYAAVPDSGTTEGTFIARVGEDGLRADVEGLTIYYASSGNGYLIASSQGSASFNVYDRQPPNKYVKTFTVQGVKGTDGIDVTNVSLGDGFPQGLFLCHSDGSPAVIRGVAYQDLGLPVDTTHDPRSSVDSSK